MKTIEREPIHHVFDDDCVCKECGFNASEWYHQRHYTWEGAANNEQMPACGYRYFISEAA